MNRVLSHLPDTEYQAFLFWLAGDDAETVEDLEQRSAADDDMLQPIEDWSDLYD